MESLFRFTQIRTPHRGVHQVDALTLASGSAYQGQLAAAGAPNRRAQQKASAQAFASSPTFVSGLEAHPFLDAMEAVQAVADAERSSAAPFSLAGFSQSVVASLGSSLSTAVPSVGLTTGLENVRDSVVTIKLLPDLHQLPIMRLVDALRIHELISRMNADPAYPADREVIAAASRLVLQLPSWMADDPRSGRKPVVSTLTAKLKTIAGRYEAIDGAVRELTSIRPSGFQSTAQAASPGRLPPRNLRPEALLQAELGVRQSALTATVLSAGSTIANPQGGLANMAGALPEILAATDGVELREVAPTTPRVRLSRGAAIAIRGRPPFTPIAQQIAMRLTPAIAGKLSAATQRALKALSLDPADPVPATVAALLAERRRLHEQAQVLLRPFLFRPSYRRVGNAVVATSSRLISQAQLASPKTLTDLLTSIWPAAVTPAPTSHSDLTPVGVMDLLVVRQNLKGYELAEVSNIENVLQSEYRSSEHRRRFESETIMYREAETQTETETSTDTADRFEMRRESQNALQEQTEVKGSLTVSGSYGPSVEFQASGEGSWSRHAEKSSSAASDVAREVTTRATDRITDRLLSRETHRTTIETEQTDQHTFDNSRGNGNIVGTYQFVSKVYEAQVMNYGQRTLYDLTIPEPGALLLAAFHRNRVAAVQLVEPPAFDARPEELTEDTYQTFVALYGATGVKPPPPPFVTEAYDFNTGGEDEDQEFANSTRIQIPDGYQAIQASVGITVMVWDNWVVDVVIGRHSHRFDGGDWVWITNLGLETGAIPFALTTDRVGDIALAVEVTCAATERATELWQAETHSQLVDAYRARRSEYESSLAALEANLPLEIVSRSSSRNRDMIVDELKRACISMLSEQHFDLFDALAIGALDLPEINFAEARAEGAYARFFEQAFEWVNMAWVTYSYFWGRKKGWLEHLVLTDGDVDFESFLKAGFARVVIPVRPGFEASVDHFRTLGEPWLGGPLPTISDQTYLAVADEIAERLDRPGTETPQGPAWEVRVPTDLVHLRQGPGLPAWAKQNDGQWLPSN